MGEEGEENVQQGSRNRVDLTGGETGASADGGKGGKWWTGGPTVPGTLTPNGRFTEYVLYTRTGKLYSVVVAVFIFHSMSSNLYIPPTFG
jgi:hypothetical protein